MNPKAEILSQPADASDAKAPAKKRPARRAKKPGAPDEPPREADGAEAGNLEWQREFFAAQRLRQARIPRRFWKKSFANFEARDVIRKRLKLDAQQFVKGFNFEKDFPQGLLMRGAIGCGKSHLAAAILMEVVAKGYSGLYYNSPDLLRDIRATFNSTGGVTEDDLLEETAEADLLVLDDLGAENVSGFVLDRLYLVVNRRYEQCKPMIVTTNMEAEELQNRMGKRIVSRLSEMCHAFGPFPEEDFRRRFLQGA